MAEQTPAPGSVIGEIEQAIIRLRNLAVVSDVRSELMNNVYPLMRLQADMVGNLLADVAERLAVAEVSIAELATMGESMILPDLAAQIDDVLAIGLALCVEVERDAELTSELERAKHRIKLGELVERYRNASGALRGELDAVTVEHEGDEGDEGDTDADA